jgi:hypothetical protein
VNTTHEDDQPVPDTAVATGAAAVAAFADQHHLTIPPQLREDLARQVLTAASQHPPTVPDYE